MIDSVIRVDISRVVAPHCSLPTMQLSRLYRGYTDPIPAPYQ